MEGGKGDRAYMYSYGPIEFTLPPAATMQAKNATRAKKTAMDFMLFDWGFGFLAFDSKIRDGVLIIHVWSDKELFWKIGSVYIGGSEQY